MTRAGHEKELEEMKGAAVKAGAAVLRGTKGFVKGVKAGYSEDGQ
jgi:hypothetical protein